MSIVRPIVRDIVRNIIKPIDGNRYAPEFVIADSQRGDFNQDWTPTGVNWRVDIEFTVDVAATGSTQRILFGSGTGGLVTLQQSAGGGITQFTYRDSASAGFTINGGARSNGETVMASIRSSGLGVELWINNVMTGSDTAVASGTTFNTLSANSNATQFFGGTFHSLQFIDDSGIQNGIYLQGDLAAETYVDLGAGVTLEGDFEIEGEAANLTSFNCLFSGPSFELLTDGSATGLIITPTGESLPNSLISGGGLVSLKRVAGVSTLSAGGNQVVVSGSVGTGALIVSAAGRNVSSFGGNDYYGGTIANLTITDGTTGETTKYLHKTPVDLGNGTALVEQTGSVARFGPELAGELEVGNGWTDLGDDTFSWSSGTSLTSLEIPVAMAAQGEIQKVVFTVSNYVGSGDFGLSSTTTNTFPSTRVTEDGTVDTTIVLDGSAGRVRFFARDTYTLTVKVSITTTTDAIVQNFTEADNLVTVAQNTRNYRCDEASGARLYDALDATKAFSYDFSGNSFMTIPPAALVSGDTASCDFIAPVGGYGATEFVFDGVDDATRAFLYMSAGVFKYSTGTVVAFIDGVQIIESTTVAPTDGLRHTLSVTAVTAASIVTVGARFNGVSSATFPIYNIAINNASPRFYPIGNGLQSQPDVLGDGSTDGTIDGTYTQSQWDVRGDNDVLLINGVERVSI